MGCVVLAIFGMRGRAFQGAASATAPCSGLGVSAMLKTSSQTSVLPVALVLPLTGSYSRVRPYTRKVVPGLTALAAGSLFSHLPLAWAPITNSELTSTTACGSAAVRTAFPSVASERKRSADFMEDVL